MNDWYVVVILDKADITRSVRSLLGQDVYILTTKIIAAVTLLCGGILFFLRKEGNQRERQLLEWADMDYLTGLYNRRSGIEQINGFLKQMKENTEQTHAFVILDLDNFKLLNDTLGHQIGDQALQEVAEILKQHFRDQDIICRLAGDEFVIFPERYSGNSHLQSHGKSAEKTLSHLFRWRKNSFHCCFYGSIACTGTGNRG